MPGALEAGRLVGTFGEVSLCACGTRTERLQTVLRLPAVLARSWARGHGWAGQSHLLTPG